jgi:hypothetical protein
MALRPENIGTRNDGHQAELVGSSFGKDSKIEDLTPDQAPAWISGNSVQTGILLGYGYKNTLTTRKDANEAAFDAFARDAYAQATQDPIVMHRLRDGFARGRSLIRSHTMDDSIRRVTEAYRTPPPASK